MSKGKTALITGASGGLGLEFARLCAMDGDDLVMVARSKNKLEAIASELSDKYGVQVTVFACDLSVKDAAQEVYEFTQEKGLSIDILINNAGFGDAGPFAYSDWKKQYNMVQLNITALMQMTHIFIKPMLERGYGKILNMSSVAAFQQARICRYTTRQKNLCAAFLNRLLKKSRTAESPLQHSARGLQQQALKKLQVWVASRPCSGMQHLQIKSLLLVMQL